jgi:MFS family permease
VSTPSRAARALVATAAALALADASIVALALPPILAEMHTTVTGVAAIVGVYALVLAVAILPGERLVRRFGPSAAGAAGLLVFAAASVGCAVAGSLGPLLVFRAIQAAGAAAGLIAAFDILDAGASAHGRRLWLGAALAGTAAGPAIGGALTEALDWRAIFAFQAPICVAAAIGCWQAKMTAEPPATSHAAFGPLWAHRDSAAAPLAATRAPAGSGSPAAPAAPGSPAPPAATRAPAAPGSPAAPAAPPAPTRAPAGSGSPAAAPPARFASPTGAALAFTSAAFTAVLFLLVLELVAGFALSPLTAAAGVTVLPIAALLASTVRGPAVARAAAGAVLLAGGAVSLAFLPEPGIGWAVVPQVLAGAGMGLALPAYAGELLPERTSTDAAYGLLARHVGIVLILAILAPVVSNRLDDLTDQAVLKGASLVLDANLPPEDKLSLAPDLFNGVNAERPREGLRQALDEHASELGADPGLAQRVDDLVVASVEDAFGIAYAIAAALALLAAVLLVRRAWKAAAAAAVLAAACIAVYAVEHHRKAPPKVVLQDPCKPRAVPDTGGFTGFLQAQVLKGLDRAACKYGSSREELVLAIADKQRAKDYERKYGVNPQSAGGLLGIIGR